MGVVNDIKQFLTPSRTKPLYSPPTVPIPARSTLLGEAYVQVTLPIKQSLCEEGSYYVTTNPTPGTGIAYGSGGTQATFVDTVAFMRVINTADPSDFAAPTVFLDSLKLIQFGTAPASTTSVQALVKLDNGFRLETGTAGVTNTPVCTNQRLSQSAAAARVITYAGAVTTIPTASAAARVVGRAMLKGGPTLNLDEYSISFGVNDSALGGGYLTTVASYASRMPPVAIGPGQSAVIHLWFVAGITNPFTYEFELGHWER